MRVVFLLLVLYISAAFSQAAPPGSAGSCVVGGVDYSGLYNAGDLISAPYESFTYYARICGPITYSNFPGTTACAPNTNPSICAYDGAVSAAYEFGVWEAGMYTSATSTGPNSVTLISNNGYASTQITWQITCGAASNSLSVGPGTPGRIFQITVTQSPCATAGGGGGGGGDGGGAPSHKLSGGWIFCIIFFVVTPVYCAAGCFWNHRKGAATWKERMPNGEFWSSIPGLMKDGFVFSINKIRGLCGGRAASTGSYETL